MRGLLYRVLDADTVKVGIASALPWLTDVDLVIKIIAGLGGCIYIWVKLVKLWDNPGPDCKKCSHRPPRKKYFNTESLVILCVIALVLFGCSGCRSVKYHQQQNADGSYATNLKSSSLFSDLTLKGLNVTTNGLRISSGTTEANPEAITATGDAVGGVAGEALKKGILNQ